jgi:hypothetical protein
MQVYIAPFSQHRWIVAVRGGAVCTVGHIGRSAPRPRGTLRDIQPPNPGLTGAGVHGETALGVRPRVAVGCPVRKCLTLVWDQIISQEVGGQGMVVRVQMATDRL